MSINDIIRDYINETHDAAYQYAIKNNKSVDEPGLISKFLENHKDLEKELNNSNKNLKYLIDVIFTHQTPKIKAIDRSRSVEIADLLLINIHHGSQKTETSGKALLIQAKRNNTPTSGSLARGTEAIQFYIYNKWPKFSFTSRSQNFKSISTNWDFNFKKSEEHSFYAVIYDSKLFHNHTLYSPSFINANFHQNCSWNTAQCEFLQVTPSKGLTCNTSFSNLFSHFIMNNAGRTFSPSLAANGEHWSIFINDMMTLAKDPSYIYHLSRQGISESQRHVRMQSFMINDAILSSVKTSLTDLEKNTSPPNHHLDLSLPNILLNYYFNEGHPPSTPKEIANTDTRIPPSTPPIMIIHTIDLEGIFTSDAYK